jgi:hypothetical protein
MYGLAAAHAVYNIMVQHQLHQDTGLGEDVAPLVAKAHSCSQCNLYCSVNRPVAAGRRT